MDNDNNDDNQNNIDPFGRFRAGKRNQRKKSENFEIVKSSGINFSDVGGYDNVKKELDQCIDIISNYTKYAKYNVRVPKDLFLKDHLEMAHIVQSTCWRSYTVLFLYPVLNFKRNM